MTIQSGDTGIVRVENARQGLRSPLSRGKNFPHSIAVAIVAITTGSAFPELARNARSVLAFAVRLADRKSPTKPSWAFKKTIAQEIGISESTVYRVINVLVDDGFIVRFEQERKARNGKLAGAKIALTEKTCVSLGLMAAQKSAVDPQPEGPEQRPETPVFLGSPSVKLQDGHSSTLLLADQRTQSLQKHSLEPAVTKRPQQGQPFFKIPRELFWLNQETHLTPPQIFLLMREFTSRKQRLGDVLATVSERVRQLPCSDVFSYLRALAKAPTDFAWLAKLRAGEVEKENRALELKALVQRLTEDMRGRYLQSATGRVYLLDGSAAQAWWIEDGTLREGACPITAGFAQDYEAGRLKIVDESAATSMIATWRERTRPRSIAPSPVSHGRTSAPCLADLMRSLSKERRVTA